MECRVKRFGVLTSGGDAPGLNAAIRALCRTAKCKYGMEAVGIFNGYRGLINGDMRILSEPDISGLIAQGGTILGTSREKPFKNPTVNEATGLLPVEAIKENYKKWNLDALVCIGGNGTNTTASLLFQSGLNVIGLPKTIDNDIEGSDVTFGFYTALDVATDAVDRIHSTACSHSRIMVVEVMGHKVGWLGLYSGISGGADAVLIPEIPYDINSVVEKIKERRNSGKNFSVIVVAEGAKSKAEALLDKKAFKKARASMHTSIGFRVAKEIEEATGLECRVTVVGYLQRSGTPSSYDRLFSTYIGSAAADFLAEEKFGNLVAVQNGIITAVPLDSVAGKTKGIPLDHPMLKTARDMGICLGE
ncbi:6-phosphofructokinase [Treponema sp.]|uniref:6-phosphofructokinase n=1 Tax=Treponema sp. TaxID=166 RepID=UPI003F03BE0E